MSPDTTHCHTMYTRPCMHGYITGLSNMYTNPCTPYALIPHYCTLSCLSPQLGRKQNVCDNILECKLLGLGAQNTLIGLGGAFSNISNLCLLIWESAVFSFISSPGLSATYALENHHQLSSTLQRPLDSPLSTCWCTTSAASSAWTDVVTTFFSSP